MTGEFCTSETVHVVRGFVQHGNTEEVASVGGR